MTSTEVDTPWRPIEGKLLGAALHEAFGTSGDVETTDIDPGFVELLLAYIEESEPLCDHSVGICACVTRGVMEELTLWVAGLRLCTNCGGEGIEDYEEIHVTSEEFGDFTDHVGITCKICGGSGTRPLEP